MRLFLRAFFALALFAAPAMVGGLGGDSHAAQDGVTSGKMFTVGFAQDTSSNAWRRAQVQHVKDMLASEPSIRFISTDAGGNTARQAQDIEDLVARGVDLLITSPRDGRALTPVIAKVHASGIPVILLSRSVVGDGYTVFIAPDNYQIARRAGERMASSLKGQGRILILEGVKTASTAKLRNKGFLDAIASFPGIKVVATLTANFQKNEAIKTVDRALAVGVKFDAIYAHSDSMAEGARQALRQAGIAPRTKVIIGIDYTSEARTAIENGEEDASFIYPTGGHEGALRAIKILKGDLSGPKNVTIPSTMVTQENVAGNKPIF